MVASKGYVYLQYAHHVRFNIHMMSFRRCCVCTVYLYYNLFPTLVEDIVYTLSNSYVFINNLKFMFQFNSATQQFTAFDLYASFTELGFEYINAFYSKVARSLSDKLRHVVICLEDPYHRKSESVSQLVSFNLPLFLRKEEDG